MRSLVFRLAASLILVSVVLSLAVALILRRGHETYHLEIGQKAFRSLAEHLAADVQLRFPHGYDFDEVLARIGRLSMRNMRIVGFVLDSQGGILRASTSEALTRQRVSLEPIRRFLDGPAQWPVLGEDPLSPDKPTIFSVARLQRSGENDFYYLYILLSLDGSSAPAPSAARSYSLEEAMWGLLASIVAGLVAALIAANIVTRPLERLRHAMEAFGKSGYAATNRCGDGGKHLLADETARLAETFDSMARQVASRIDELRQADESRKRLFAGVSHDLATPLAALQGYIDTLIMKKESLPESEKQRCLAVARRQIDHINDLVDRIREFAQLESPTLRMDTKTLVVDELVRDVLERFSRDVEQKRLAVSVRPGDRPSLVRGDRDLLERAIGNVVHNAIRFSPAGGELCVRIVPMSGTVELEITDQGPGIAQEDFGVLFKEFYRGKQPSWGGRLGSGLGLAIARKIIEHHGGVIRARNRAEGGASFHIALATGLGEAPGG